jgi:tRNA nucleotidyltransferase/poly(A) polymerase
MSKSVRNKIKEILEETYLSEDMKKSQKQRLVSMLNALEFKNDVLAAGGEIYAVGGIVRDAVMGTPSDDLDIVVRGIPYDQLFSILSKYGTPTDTSHVDENGKKDFGSTKFVSKNENFNQFLDMNGVVHDIDVMLPRKDMKDPGVKGHKGIKSDVNPMYTIKDDLDRRDITINAIAMDLAGNMIVNSTGLEDIKNGIIKAVSEDAFVEDPLRMLRAVRFAARYNYNWDPATIDLIKKNAGMLADKAELPKERFLGEFKKMIGKADLGRAVKMLVDFGMYKAIFGVEPKIKDYSIFDKSHNVGEMAFMMFENEPLDSIVPLIERNITNDNYILDYARALVEYKKGEKIAKTQLEKAVLMARLYKISKDAMLDSVYVAPDFKDIARKFESGALPKDDHDLTFKGEDFKDYVFNKIIDVDGQFLPKRDGVKMGRAKSLVLLNIFEGKLKNEREAIKNFLDNNTDKWMV